jgi:hypothetical protein
MKLLKLFLLPLALGFATLGYSQTDGPGFPAASVTDGEVTIWPNPFRDDLNIMVNNLHTEDLTIQVVNSRLRVLSEYRGEFHIQTVMNLSSLPAGTYWVLIIKDGQTIAKRAVRKRN